MLKNDFEKVKKEMINKQIDYELLGNLKTLKGTDNYFWYAYSPKLDIAFKSIKKTDIIIDVWNGKKTVIEPLQKKDLKLKSCIKWYQKIRIEIVSTVWAVLTILINHKRSVEIAKRNG